MKISKFRNLFRKSIVDSETRCFTGSEINFKLLILWNLRYEDNNPIDLSSSSFYNPFAGVSEGTLVNPGTYSIDMSILKAGETTKVADAQSFNVVALNNTVMPADDRAAKVNFQRKVSKLQAEMGEYSRKFSEISNKMPYIAEAIKKVEQPVDEISKMEWDVKQAIKEVWPNLFS